MCLLRVRAHSPLVQKSLQSGNENKTWDMVMVRPVSEGPLGSLGRTDCSASDQREQRR